MDAFNGNTCGVNALHIGEWTLSVRRALWRALVVQVTGRRVVVDGVRGGVLADAWRWRPSVQAKRGVGKVSGQECHPAPGCIMRGVRLRAERQQAEVPASWRWPDSACEPSASASLVNTSRPIAFASSRFTKEQRSFLPFPHKSHVTEFKPYELRNGMHKRCCIFGIYEIIDRLAGWLVISILANQVASAGELIIIYDNLTIISCDDSYLIPSISSLFYNSVLYFSNILLIVLSLFCKCYCNCLLKRLFTIIFVYSTASWTMRSCPFTVVPIEVSFDHTFFKSFFLLSAHCLDHYYHLFISPNARYLNFLSLNSLKKWNVVVEKRSSY